MEDHSLASPASATAALVHLRRAGYLVLRGYLDPLMLADVRDDIARTLERWHLIIGSRSRHGSCRLEWSGASITHLDRRALEATPSARSLADSLASGTCAPLTSLARRLLGASARTAGRLHVYCAFPDHRRFSPPPHQDTYGIGRNRCLRLWIPITDIRPLDGGLVVATGSHLAGRRAVTVQTDYATRPLTINGVTQSTSHPIALGWSAADHWVGGGFGPGDVVAMHPNLVHAALPRLSNSVRLAIAVDVATGTLDRASEQAWTADGMDTGGFGGVSVGTTAREAS